MVIFLHVCRSAGGSYAPAWEIRKGNGQPTDGICGRPGWRPEQLLGLARAPRNRLLSIHLRTINDVAGVMPDVG